ncbi:glycosyltransferase family 4 protein [Jatrophihabitans fulvus]
MAAAAPMAMNGTRVLIAHPSADVYGSDLQVAESIAGLRSAGCHVSLHLPEDGPLLERVTGAETRIEPFLVLRKSLLRPRGLLSLPLLILRDVVRLLRRIRHERPDVVYVNTVTIPLWVIAAWILRVPVMVHVHEAEGAASSVPRVIRTALGLPLLLARSVVANSRASADVLFETAPRLRRKTTVVYNGVPDRGPCDPERSTAGRVVLVGRLSPRKGTDIALEAVALLRRTRRDVTLDICGTAYEGYEWFEKQLTDRASLPDLAGAVTFLGYVNPTTDALERAAVVVVPSRAEPFGNTAVEAQLARRPVVASAVQGLAEVVQHRQTGLLVPTDDAEALAGAIAEVLDDVQNAARLAENGRESARARFSVTRYRSDINACVLRLAHRQDV